MRKSGREKFLKNLSEEKWPRITRITRIGIKTMLFYSRIRVIRVIRGYFFLLCYNPAAFWRNCPS
jgi:hypothetical protein